VSTLASEVTGKLNSLKGLEKHLKEILGYLNNVIDGVIPPNHQILYNLQDIFNLSPNLRVEDLVKSFTTKTNDSMLVIYLSSFIRSIVALHDLINNKLANKEAMKKKHDLILQKKQEKAEKAAEKEKEKAEKEKEKTEKSDSRSS
jgi:26S proteasome regulatory subunit N8